MKRSNMWRLFSTTTWRGWLGTVRRWEKAMDLDEFDRLERRIQNLETQVADLRLHAGKP